MITLWYGSLGLNIEKFCYILTAAIARLFPWLLQFYSLFSVLILKWRVTYSEYFHSEFHKETCRIVAMTSLFALTLPTFMYGFCPHCALSVQASINRLCHFRTKLLETVHFSFLLMSIGSCPSAHRTGLPFGAPPLPLTSQMLTRLLFKGKSSNK